jgi:hypothetical protein
MRTQWGVTVKGHAGEDEIRRSQVSWQRAAVSATPDSISQCSCFYWNFIVCFGHQNCKFKLYCLCLYTSLPFLICLASSSYQVRNKSPFVTGTVELQAMLRKCNNCLWRSNFKVKSLVNDLLSWKDNSNNGWHFPTIRKPCYALCTGAAALTWHKCVVDHYILDSRVMQRIVIRVKLQNSKCPFYQSEAFLIICPCHVQPTRRGRLAGIDGGNVSIHHTCVYIVQQLIKTLMQKQ